jgi:hypothetical protein
LRRPPAGVPVAPAPSIPGKSCDTFFEPCSCVVIVRTIAPSQVTSARTIRFGDAYWVKRTVRVPAKFKIQNPKRVVRFPGRSNARGDRRPRGERPPPCARAKRGRERGVRRDRKSCTQADLAIIRARARRAPQHRPWVGKHLYGRRTLGKPACRPVHDRRRRRQARKDLRTAPVTQLGTQPT